MPPDEHVLEVFGDLACFSSPAAKVERMSLPVMPPSCARGILDSIYVKPVEFRWQVTRIEIFTPIRYIALRRNEVKEKVSTLDVNAWMAGRKPPEPVLADADKSSTGTDQKGRTQRQTMALLNVKYRIAAKIVPWPHTGVRLVALNEQFARRARGGKCVMQPCFGCREFPAYFRYVEADEPPASPEPINMDLDWMVYDVFDLSLSNRILCTGRHDKKSPNFARFIEKPSISVFHAVVVNGVLTVPDYEDTAVRKLTSVERGTDSCQYQN